MPARRRQLLEDAVKLMGRKQVAEALRASEATLDAWLKGEQALPASKLTALARAAVDFAKRIKRD